MAEGRRGRRWRSVRCDASRRIVADLLLEVDPTGRWTRLELATAAGLLTLHPEPDGGAVHGNAVTGAGMRHLALPWRSGHRLVVEAEPVAVCALVATNASAAGPGLLVTSDLEVAARSDLVAPRPARPDGLPGPSWPLEADAEMVVGTPEG